MMRLIGLMLCLLVVSSWVPVAVAAPLDQATAAETEYVVAGGCIMRTLDETVGPFRGHAGGFAGGAAAGAGNRGVIHERLRDLDTALR